MTKKKTENKFEKYVGTRGLKSLPVTMQIVEEKDKEKIVPTMKSAESNFYQTTEAPVVLIFWRLV